MGLVTEATRCYLPVLDRNDEFVRGQVVEGTAATRLRQRLRIEPDLTLHKRSAKKEVSIIEAEVRRPARHGQFLTHNQAVMRISNYAPLFHTLSIPSDFPISQRLGSRARLTACMVVSEQVTGSQINLMTTVHVWQ